MKTKHMTTSQLRNSLNRSPWRLGLPRVQPIWIIRGFLLIPVALACFALSPTAQGVSPAPDGGYPNQNTAEGDNALFSLTSATGNTAIGFDALYHATIGGGSTAIGYQALYSQTTGGNNTASGVNALFSDTTGSYNTASGISVLLSNTTGSYNTANGSQALFNNTTGGNNTATGFDALGGNTTGHHNTANGVLALSQNATGYDNTATGYQALYGNTTGINNTANGYQALFGNVSNLSTGSNNTANGYRALYSYTTGGSNTADGYQALYFNTTGSFNTANGYQALYHNTTGVNNVTLGYQAGINLTTGNNNIDIGNIGLAAEASTIRIGAANQTRAFIAGIRGKTTANANAVPVVIDSAGQLGTVSSSRRFKHEIKPMDQTSEAILGLKPVTFHYKTDNTGTPQFGLIAEDVAKVSPDLVVRDDDGEIYTVRYEAVNAMLLNEFLKEHREVQEQKATITQLKSSASKQEATIAKQQKQIEALATGLQKVSDRLELNKPARQIVDNNQ
jgi:Chaperone of endosialidase